MVSGKMNPVLGHQKLRGLQRHQRAGEAVAQIDDGVHAPAFDVLEHGFEGGEVAVDVGDDG